MPPQELDVPFYFTPGKVAGTFHCSTPALGDVAYVLRRSSPPTRLAHTIHDSCVQLGVAQRRPQSLALARVGRIAQDDRLAARDPRRLSGVGTTASGTDGPDFGDVACGEAVEQGDRVRLCSPSCVCVWSMTDGGSYRMEVDFGKHPESVTRTSGVRIVRYQQNPAPNWGPGSRAGGKRKRARSESDEGR